MTRVRLRRRDVSHSHHNAEATRVLKLATGTSSSGESAHGAPRAPHSTRSFDDAASGNSASHSRSEMEGNIETATRKLQRDLCAQQLHIERPIGKGGFGTVYKGAPPHTRAQACWLICHFASS